MRERRRLRDAFFAHQITRAAASLQSIIKSEIRASGIDYATGNDGAREAREREG
jgi:hypothetical protein